MLSIAPATKLQSGPVAPLLVTRGQLGLPLPLSKAYRCGKKTMTASKAKPSVVRIEAGIDWISATLPMYCEGSEIWYERSQHIIAEIARSGYELKKRSMLGFDGISAGNLFVGISDDRVFLVITSHNADKYFLRVDREDLHYTRLDVQATVWFSEEVRTVARKGYNELSNRDKLRNKPGNRKYRIIAGSDGGDTLYVGAPSSRQQAVIYNKARESEKEEYRNAWRHEVRLRDSLACGYAECSRNGGDSLASRHLGYVYNWLNDRGISVPYLRTDARVVLPKQQHTPSDIDSKLRWLERQVRPTVKFLTEAGYRDKLLEALELLL